MRIRRDAHSALANRLENGYMEGHVERCTRSTTASA